MRNVSRYHFFHYFNFGYYHKVGEVLKCEIHSTVLMDMTQHSAEREQVLRWRDPSRVSTGWHSLSLGRFSRSLALACKFNRKHRLFSECHNAMETLEEDFRKTIQLQNDVLDLMAGIGYGELTRGIFEQKANTEEEKKVERRAKERLNQLLKEIRQTNLENNYVDSDQSPLKGIEAQVN